MSDAGFDATLAPEVKPLSVGGEVRDFVALLKPRVMSLVVFTALVGLLVAPVSLHPFVAVSAILFIALGAGASGALSGSKAQSLSNRLWESLSAHVYVFLHQTRLSDVIQNDLAPCPAVPSLFAVVDET